MNTLNILTRRAASQSESQAEPQAEPQSAPHLATGLASESKFRSAWTLATVVCIGLVLLVSLGGCAGMSGQEKNTAVGAGLGAIGGAVLTGGSAVGTVGGAAVGGYIGHETGN